MGVLVQKVQKNLVIIYNNKILRDLTIFLVFRFLIFAKYVKVCLNY
jgi:hypothetical protein